MTRGSPNIHRVQSPLLPKAQCLDFNLLRMELRETKLPKPLSEDKGISGLLEAAATGPA